MGACAGGCGRGRAAASARWHVRRVCRYACTCTHVGVPMGLAVPAQGPPPPPGPPWPTCRICGLQLHVSAAAQALGAAGHGRLIRRGCHHVGWVVRENVLHASATTVHGMAAREAGAVTTQHSTARHGTCLLLHWPRRTGEGSHPMQKAPSRAPTAGCRQALEAASYHAQCGPRHVYVRCPASTSLPEGTRAQRCTPTNLSEHPAQRVERHALRGPVTGRCHAHDVQERRLVCDAADGGQRRGRVEVAVGHELEAGHKARAPVAVVVVRVRCQCCCARRHRPGPGRRFAGGSSGVGSRSRLGIRAETVGWAGACWDGRPGEQRACGAGTRGGGGRD